MRDWHTELGMLLDTRLGVHSPSAARDGRLSFRERFVFVYAGDQPEPKQCVCQNPTYLPL